MKTAKIEKIMEVKEWTWDFWTTYYISLKMDNWDMITLGKKSKDAFKEWDTVSYESYEKDWKIKYKEIKENNFKPRAYNPEANNRGAMVWLAIKTAFEHSYKKEDDFQKTIFLAQRIFDEAMNMYNWKPSEEKTEQKPTQNKQSEMEDLPF